MTNSPSWKRLRLSLWCTLSSRLEMLRVPTVLKNPDRGTTFPIRRECTPGPFQSPVKTLKPEALKAEGDKTWHAIPRVKTHGMPGEGPKARGSSPQGHLAAIESSLGGIIRSPNRMLGPPLVATLLAYTIHTPRLQPKGLRHTPRARGHVPGELTVPGLEAAGTCARGVGVAFKA